MKLAVVGSRTFSNRHLAFNTLDRLTSAKPVELVISGGANGADSLAADWAKSRNLPTRIHLPDWTRHGRRAGFLRNQLIVADADALIAFWDGKSRGAAHSISLARNRRIPIRIIKI